MWSACRIGNLVMMKQWLWMKPSVRLLSMGCLQQVVGDWVYIDRLTMLLTDSQNIKVLFSSLSLSLSLSQVCACLHLSHLYKYVYTLCSQWALNICYLVTGGYSLPSHETSRWAILLKVLFPAMIPQVIMVTLFITINKNYDLVLESVCLAFDNGVF